MAGDYLRNRSNVCKGCSILQNRKRRDLGEIRRAFRLPPRLDVSEKDSLLLRIRQNVFEKHKRLDSMVVIEVMVASGKWQMMNCVVPALSAR